MSAETPIVTGYYRYTDVWFEWFKVLQNPDDAQALKAVLAHDALVHPDHPLHPGVEGIQMYLGTFKSGEARLLLSSAQVDYLRYWLHAMKLTKEVIPLLYSDCLLTTSNLKTISPVTYKTGGELRQALKGIEKNNKRLKGTRIDSILDDRRLLFERGRTFWGKQQGVWVSMDFEDWEYDHSICLEFGWRYVTWKDGKRIDKCGHLMPTISKSYRNGKWVQDNRDHYQFGKTEVVATSEFKERVKTFVEEVKAFGPVFFVFHDGHAEIKNMKAIGVDIEGIVQGLPDKMPEKGLFVVDTGDLLPALLGDSSNNKRSLEKTCALLKVDTKFLHNAGNDAHYTLQALEEMLSGDPLDIQREKRWPNQTVAGLKVDIQEWQEEAYDDQEGLFPVIPNLTSEREDETAA